MNKKKGFLLFGVYLFFCTLIFAFQVFENQYIRGFLRLAYIASIYFFLIKNVSIVVLKNYQLILIGLVGNAFFVSFFDTLVQYNFAVLAAFMILVAKCIILAHLLKHPSQEIAEVKFLFYYFIPLGLSFLFDVFVLINNLPASTIAINIILTVVNPLIISKSLHLDFAPSGKKYFVVGLFLLAILDYWEIYFHLTTPAHMPINLWALINLLPYPLVVYGIFLAGVENLDVKLEKLSKSESKKMEVDH